MAENLEPIKQQIDIEITESGTASTTEKVQSLGKENKKVEDSFKSLKVQLREAIVEQQKMAQKFGATSEEAIKAAKAVAEIKDEIGFANDLAESFNPDQKFKALGAASQLAATGVQGVTAGMALFGETGEQTEKVLLQVQAAMAFSDSISNLSNLSDQFKVLQTVVRDTFAKIVAAKAAEKSATDAGTASQLRQNLAVLANPYVIAGAAIAALTIGIYAWAKANGEAAKREEEVTKSVAQNSLATKDLSRSIEDAKNATQTSNDIEVLRARAYGKTDEEIKKLIKSQKELAVATTLTQSKQAYDNLLKANKDYWDAVKTGNQDLIDSAKENQDEAKELYKASNQSFNDSINEQTKYVLETKIAENEKLKQLSDQREAEEKAAAARRREEGKKEREDIKRQREEDQKALNEFQIKTFEAKIQNTLLEAEKEAENRKAITDQVDAIEFERAEKQKLIEQSILEQKEFIENKKAEIAENGIRLIASVFSKSKAVQKAAIIAENALGIGKQVIANNTANAGALATPQAIATSGASAIPVIALNNISTGIGIASTIAATAKALSAVGGGGASGAGGGTPQPSRNVAQVGFQASSENAIGNAVANQQKKMPPVEAFVVSQKIKDEEELNRKKELNNSF